MSEPTIRDAAPRPTEDSGYRIRVGEFEGPLDLLLHLVRSSEIDITDIPIVSITEQYTAYLELMREMNLEIAGEYLVMAATLMHIKSRMLLPPDPELAGEEESDPRAELAQQLLEYQRLKQASENLEAMDSRRNLIWTRDRMFEEFEGEELLTVDLFDLLKAFRQVLGRLGEEEQLALRRDTVSVAEKIGWLTDLLQRRPSLDLLELLEGLPTRLDRIATFLALLEMMKLQLVAVFQRKIFGDIRVVAVGPPVRSGDGADPDAPALEEAAAPAAGDGEVSS